MWSEGGWTGPDYRVSYAMASSPLGPFLNVTGTRILQQDAAVAKGSGHNGVIHVPGTDIYYIVYHRRPLSEDAGEHRVLCYDRMYFGPDGAIAPVKMLVKDNFADGDMVGWKTYNWGGAADGVGVADGRLVVASREKEGVVVALDTNFLDQTFDATIVLSNSSSNSSGVSPSAGLVFGATNITAGPYKMTGYYVGLSTAGRVLAMNLADGTAVVVEGQDIKPGVEHRVRVSAVGDNIAVFVNDFAAPKLSFSGAGRTAGMNGVAAFNMQASFGSVSVGEVD